MAIKADKSRIDSGEGKAKAGPSNEPKASKVGKPVARPTARKS